jgi:hypothetical protein
MDLEAHDNVESRIGDKKFEVSVRHVEENNSFKIA